MITKGVKHGRAFANAPANAVHAAAAACLLMLSGMSSAETAALSGKVNWGDREICKGSQGRMLVFSGDAGKAQAPVGQDGYYSVKLEPGSYRVTLKCGGSDIKTLNVIGYPTPTQQDLAF